MRPLSVLSVTLGVLWPNPQRGTAPNFWPLSVVAKRLDGLRCHLAVGQSRGDSVLHEDPAPPKTGAQQPPTLFSPCLLWPNGRPSQQLLSSCSNITAN